MDNGTITVWFDMDGVLAKWDTSASLEDTFKPGYFLKRAPDHNAFGLLARLIEEGFNVGVVSAAYTEGTAASDKLEWLRRQGMFAVGVEVRIVSFGKPKTDFIKVSKTDILIDDFTQNLADWEKAGGVAVKYLNGINGKKHRWNGPVLRHGQNPEEMLSEIRKAAGITGEAKSVKWRLPLLANDMQAI